MTFETILIQSSNVGISLATEKAGFQYLNEIISRLKILEKTGVDYPGEVAGIMEDFSSWAKVTGYNISFGQGITASPLQMGDLQRRRVDYSAFPPFEASNGNLGGI